MEIFMQKDIKILKNALKEYNEIKKDINKKIKKGYTMEDLYSYIRHCNAYYITNYELNDATCDEKIIDFNTEYSALTLYEDSKIVLADEMVVWNDNEGECLGSYSTKEIKKLIKKLEELYETNKEVF